MSSEPGYRCHVRSYGSGPPVLLLHGVAGSGLIWQPVVDALQDRFQLIVVDLLGYGHSPKPRIRYTPALHVEVVHRSVAELVDRRPVAVMGLSMGCVLAAEYAAAHPGEVRLAVMIGLPYYRSDKEARKGLRANAWTAMTVYAPPIARVVIGMTWGLGRHSGWLSRRLAPRIYAGEVAREAMMARYHSFASTLRHCLVEHRVGPTLEQLDSLPLTLIHGDADRWCPAERVEELAAQLANSRFYLVESAHNAVVLAPGPVAELAETALS